MALGMFLFSAVDTQAKFLTDSLHPIQIVWFRQLGLLFGVVALLAIRGVGILKTGHPFVQMSRGVLAASSATIFIIAIKYVPIADAVAVSFVAPFMVTVLGALALKEPVGRRRWTAVGIGFAATLIIIRPGLGVFHPAMFLILLAAFLFALRQVVSRVLGGADRTVTTVAYTALTASAVLTIPVGFVWKTPQWGLEVALLISIAVMAAAAEILVIRALELAQAVVVAPIHYSLIIWATMYGWVVFGDLPDRWTWLGLSIIVATGIYTLNRERRARSG